MHELDASLTRGCVVRLLVDSRILSNPARVSRNKFAVILNVDCTDTEIFFALTGTGSDFFEPTEALRIEAGEYSFFPQETFLNLRLIFSKTLIKLRELHDEKKLTVKGVLNEAHLREIDMKLRMSALVVGRQKERILPSG